MRGAGSDLGLTYGCGTAALASGTLPQRGIHGYGPRWQKLALR